MFFFLITQMNPKLKFHIPIFIFPLSVYLINVDFSRWRFYYKSQCQNWIINNYSLRIKSLKYYKNGE